MNRNPGNAKAGKRTTASLILLALLLANVAVLLSPFVQPAFAQSSMYSGVVVGREADPGVKLVKDAKLGWIRVDVRSTENFDKAYSSCNKYRVSMIGVLDFWTMNWNSSFTLDDWSIAVAKAQSKYPSIRVWEIWNEPTWPHYQVGYMDGTPGHYTEMLMSAYTILKAANPNYVVLGFGGAQFGIPGDYLFAQSVFALGGGAYMDAISVHAYAYQLNKGASWDTYKQMWTQEFSKYKELGKPIWLTETGLRSDQSSEADQSAYLQASYQFFLEQGAMSFIWYGLKDYKTAEGTVVSFGLVRVDLTTKPSYLLYKSLQH